MSNPIAIALASLLLGLPAFADDVRLAVPASTHLDRSLGALVPDAFARLPGEIPAVVPDEFVIRLVPEAAITVRTLGIGADGRTGFEPIDSLRETVAVTGCRPLFPGAEPFADAVRGLPDMSGWFVVRIDASVTALGDAMDAFATNPFVEHVEAIGVHPIYATPNDGSYPSQWHLHQANDKDIDAPEAWNLETGDPSIVVAVLDTGVRYFHKDLGGSGGSLANPSGANGNIWLNVAEKNGIAGVDDDANGYVDDWVGYDFVSEAIWTCWSGEDCTGADNDPRDFNGHGTHCAGVVSAMNNNGYAVASPAGGWGSGSNAMTGSGVKTMCLRVGHSANYGGQEVGFVRMDFAASAFYYAANKGARIASCSWGSSNSGGLAAAVTYFINAGGLVFKAAGNDGSQTADYLCSRTDVYSVVATDQSDLKASFSTYGTWADISAPGVGILSTYHVHSDATNDYVATLSGTSMATPLVASVAAGVWSANPSWTRTQVWDQVRTTADPIDSLNPSYAGKLGSGRVNHHNAISGSPPPPPPGATGKVVMALTGSPNLPGVGVVADEDLVQYDNVTGTWSLYFDGSDVGLASYTIDAVARTSSGELLISLTAAGSLAGLVGAPSGTSFDDSDILRFTPTSLGSTTSGTWTFHFDGSDVGLSSNDEDIDAVGILPDGRLAISATGTPTVPGLSGLADEDLIAFNATSLGSVTSGSWSYWFDGSDVGLSTSADEDVDGAAIDSSGKAYLTTLGNFSVTGVSGTSRDIFSFTPTSTGSSTSGSFASYFSATAAGVPTSANVTGLFLLP